MWRISGCGAAIFILTAYGVQPGAAAAPGTLSTITKQSCDLKTDRDLIEWHRYRHPAYSDGSTGPPDSAVEIGNVDLVHCTSTLDGWVQMHQGSTADAAAGYRDCYEIAWADQNPGYNVEARPAPRLKHVLLQAGNDC